jgi:hypothetical protein
MAEARERAPVERAVAYPPRGMRRIEAARYVGVSPTLFSEWVRAGTMPEGKREGGVVLWDRHALDDALDQLFDTSPEDIRL